MRRQIYKVNTKQDAPANDKYIALATAFIKDVRDLFVEAPRSGKKRVSVRIPEDIVKEVVSRAKELLK